MLYTYCLFCDTTQCDYVARAAIQFLGCDAISPKRIQHTWSKGAMRDYIRQWLPGYVFLYSEDEPLKITQIRQLDGVLRCLRNRDNSFELAGSDEAFAMMLYQKGGIIGKTPVHEKDGQFRIADDIFSGIKPTILKVDRRNSRMKIVIPFAGKEINTWVEYEIIEKGNTGETKMSQFDCHTDS